MIASLRGTLLEKDAASCVVECAGVGYLVSVSTHTARTLPKPGEDVFLRTRQVVREDAVQLFGFAEPEEQRLFDLLIGVSGVGPRLGLAVLSGLRPSALARAIRDEHVAALVAIPGIGRKTAERLVVELRDKLVGFETAATLAEPAGSREPGILPRSERFEDAVAALTRLGYTAAQAQEAVRRAADAAGESSAEALVRRALAALGKPGLVSR
jgi:Holliday junction DNA helicase RuvA